MQDGLRQVTNYIKNTQKKAATSFRREVPVEDYFERIRDVFDTDNSFVGKFKVPNHAGKISLDLNFGPRNQTLDCCTDCVCSATEYFIDTDLIENSIFVVRSYIATSTRVFLDGNLLVLGVDYFESDPNGRKLTFVTLGSSYTVSYQYIAADCAPEDFPCTLDLPDAGIIGLARVFSDRFDRASGPYPTGNCGFWAVNSNFLDTPLATFNTAGGRSAGGTISWGTHYAIGATVEVIAAIDMSEWNSSLMTWTFNLEGPAFYNAGAFLQNISGLWHIGLFGYFQAIQEDNPNSGIDETDLRMERQGSFAKTTPITPPIAPVFVRYQQIPNFGWQVKVWAQDADEPTGWDIQLTLSDAVSGTVFENSFIDPVPYLKERFIETAMVRYANATTTNGAFLQAIEIYAAGDIGLMCNTNGFGITGDSIAVPEYQINLTFPHFVDPVAGLGNLASIGQTTATVCSAGASLIKISGEVSIGNGGFVWIGGGWNEPFNIVLPVVFESYNGHGGQLTSCFPQQDGLVRFGGCSPGATTVSCNTNGCPEGYTPYGFSGNQVGSAECPTGSGGGGDFESGWIPFTIYVSPGEGGIATWGVRIPDLTFISGLPFFFGSFLFPNNANFTVGFRNVHAYGLPIVKCTAPDFCPDHSGPEGRMSEITDLNTVKTGFNYFCGTFGSSSSKLHTLTYQPDVGPTASILQYQSSKIDFLSGETKVSFRPNGITQDKSDGLCAVDSASIPQLGPYSSTFSHVDFLYEGPWDVSREQDVEVYGEFLFSNAMSRWNPDNAFDAQTPFVALRFGGNTNGQPYMAVLLHPNGNSMTKGFYISEFSTFTGNAGEWWAIKMRITDGVQVKSKIWNTALGEPDDWTYIGSDIGTTIRDTFVVKVEYSNYIQDDFYMKYRNFSMRYV